MSENGNQVNVVAIIQARMKSSRLPGKVLLDIQGKPMLTRVLERVTLAKRIDRVVLATTDGVDDNPLADYCRENQIACYRGSLYDVLDRYYQAAASAQADVVVRLTSDCPLLDPGLIDETIAVLLGEGQTQAQWIPASNNPEACPPPMDVRFPWDFAATRLPPPWERSFPIGLDVEACTHAALKKAWQEASAPYEREHVMPYLYDEPDRFRCIVGGWQENYGFHRWTVDTADDLKLVNEIYARLKGEFTWLDVLALMKTNLQLFEINAAIHHKDFREVDSRRR